MITIMVKNETFYCLISDYRVPISEIHSLSVRAMTKPWPQIDIAEQLVTQWRHAEDLLREASPAGYEMLLDGKAPLPGQVMKFPNLAKTFRAVAERGKDGFYTGRIAEAIVEVIKSKGGVMELEDLAKHTSSFVEPIKYTYAGEVTVYEVSPRQLHNEWSS